MSRETPLSAQNTAKHITETQLRSVKRRAKQLSRSRRDVTYMQCLDIVCQEDFGLRHFHQAQQLASRKAPSTASVNTAEPSSAAWTLYLQACQDSYFEL